LAVARQGFQKLLPWTLSGLDKVSNTGPIEDEPSSRMKNVPPSWQYQFQILPELLFRLEELSR